MTRRKIVAMAGITLTSAIILAGIVYFRYPKPNIGHHGKSRDIITALPQDHERFLLDMEILLNHARQYNLDKIPDPAIDIALEAIKKNRASNPIHDTKYYRLEAALYEELATSLGLKKDTERQKQAQDISNEAWNKLYYMENLKREEGLREMLQRNTSRRRAPTKNTHVATNSRCEEPNPCPSVTYRPATNKCIPA